ncbi:MAG: Rieske 2Fe-2S domain-containing protein [Cyclobacteriaceae bacterium]
METIVLFDSIAEGIKIIGNREIKKIRVDRREYGITRYEEEFYVFDVYCPHMEYDLTTGKVSPAATVICPWHNYQFRLQTGIELEDRCKRLVIKKAFSNTEGNLCFDPW